MQFDSNTSSTWQFGHRGRVAVFIDGNNLFHAARFHNLDIDYNKLLRVLLGDGRLLRAFFYTGVDAGAERQQGFLLWMRRNGFRVVQKELKTFFDGTRKANLDVEIAVDMLSLAGSYDTAVLVSGDEDFVYAVNAVAYKGCRVEVAGFRSNTAPHLIDVADFFIDLGEIADMVSKDASQEQEYDIPAFVPPGDADDDSGQRSRNRIHQTDPGRSVKNDRDIHKTTDTTDNDSDDREKSRREEKDLVRVTDER
ncbi:MAG: NYN domain-containing protein [Acidobacteria bacterium]|nr:MAG: NYN domain-containing protein [Acidobacteriota bacterium]REK02204.1 MAG: NYN domain-containing protein [Acidobacteriota bacterium]REK13993.1 MAG: NYN domain-containing protein [Acidobacteriota bacterium]REK41988.1 MAG: NYN domain-containing protein [Acidobacteriota bacterium]